MVTGMQALARSRRGVVAEPPACPPGWHTAPPDFVGVGAYRSGTSWWYQLVANHPAVEGVAGIRRRLARRERPEPSSSVSALSTLPPGKELRFFDTFVDRELLWTHVGLYQRFFPRPEGSIAGEWSPNYCSDFWIPPLLARAAPDAKLLLLLRDPVERLRSTLGFVATSAEMGGTRLAIDVWNTERDRSRYLEQLSRLLRFFDREQILVLQYESCCEDPIGELRRTYEFLGLEPPDHRPVALDTVVAGARRAKPVLREELRQELVSELGDEVQALSERFPEVDLELWPNFRRR